MKGSDKTTIFISVFIAILFLIVGFQTCSNTSFLSSKNDVLVTKYKIGNEQTTINFSYKDEDDIHANESLTFLTTHHIVDVFVDNEQVYSLHSKKDALSKTTGTIWNSIPIEKNYAKKEISIILSPIYDTANGSVTFYQGDILKITELILIKDLGEFLITGFLFFMGITLTVYALINRKFYFKNTNLFFIALLTFIVAIWRLPEINIIKIYIPNGAFWSDLGLTILALIPLTFSFYIKKLLHHKSLLIWRISITINAVLFSACIIFQLIGMYDLRETLFLTKIAIANTFAFTLYGVIIEIRKTRTVSKNVSGLIFLLSLGTVNYLLFKIYGTSNIILSLGFLVYFAYVALQQILLSKDIEVQAAKNDIFNEIAQIDSVSGLLNKNAFQVKVKKSLQTDRSAAFFLIDLDNFKAINKSFGKEYGDTVLGKVANKITQVFTDNNIFGRLDGDRFVILVTNYKSIEELQINASNLVESIKTDYIKNEAVIPLTCSIGISLFPKHGETYEKLFQTAESAMYSIKQKSRSNYAIFNVNIVQRPLAKIKNYLGDINKLPFSVMVCKNDENFTILSANDYAYKLIDCSKQEIEEKHLNRFTDFLFDSPEDFLKRLETITHGKETTLDHVYKIKNKKNSYKWLHDITRYDNESDLFYVTATDVSDRVEHNDKTDFPFKIT